MRNCAVVIERNDGASGTFEPVTGPSLEAEAVDDRTPPTHNQTLVYCEFPFRSVAEKSGEMGEDRIAADDRFATGFTVRRIGRKVRDRV